MSLAQETLSNTFDFAHKLVHARQMSDLLNLQSEFFSRQAQVVAAQSKEVGESTVRGVHEAGRMASQDIETTSKGIPSCIIWRAHGVPWYPPTRDGVQSEK